MFLFACWTGLSVSELVSISWEDCDLANMKIKVQRARVSGEYKVTKAKSRTRELDLLQPAIDILLDQKRYTFNQSPSVIQVRRRNNTKFQEQSVRFIFKNDRPECEDGHWKSKAVQGAYAELLKAGKIRRRGSNQNRHTYASMLLTRFIPLDLVASQMGHTSIKMVIKHYGKIIPEDRPNVAKMISAMMNINYTFTPPK
jgi:integrase